MEAERRWSDKVPSAASIGCGGCISQCLGPLHRSRSSSDRMVKLLDEDTTFPNLSKNRQEFLKDSFFSGCSQSAYIYSRPSLAKESEIGSYLDAESPVYSELLKDVPIVVEVGKKLNVFDLLGYGNLLSFNSSTSTTENVPDSHKPTKSRSYAGSLDSSMGVDRSFGPGMGISKWGKGSPNVQNIHALKFRSCIMASTSKTRQSQENVNMKNTLNLKGKYIMIYCVSVPSIWSSVDARKVYHTALASHELARRDDFVLVVVPMMRKGFTHDYSAYRHFLSGFSCLAVPFHEILRREFICSTLGFQGSSEVLIVDPSQMVLYHGWPQVFTLVGGAEYGCFPFTMDRLVDFDRLDSVLENRSLNELLGLSDTDVLYNIQFHAGGRLNEGGCITISELKKKFVGIYFCISGRGLLGLQEVYVECKRKAYELEIVVVGCPFDGNVPPKLKDEFIIEAISSVKLLLGWWFFPFDNTVCHRLWRLCEMRHGEDYLVVVNPIKKYVDPYGLSIISDFGIDGYPFTRLGLIEKEHQRKLRLRLNSLLLPWTHVCRKLDSGSILEIPVGEVLNKDNTVLLYLHEAPMKLILARKLGAWYKNNIKGKVSNVEVVAVSLDGGRSGTWDEGFMDMGWLVCPTDPSKSDKVCKEFFHPCCELEVLEEVVVAFGADGQIQTMDASHILQSQGPPFHGDLREEILKEFHKASFGYMMQIESVST